MNNLVGKIYKLCFAVVAILRECSKDALTLLASSAETSDSNATTQNAVRGGVLNYRTGNFDDGTDANGWYEKD